MTTNYNKNISDSGLTIYDPITVGDPNLWIPSSELESILNKGLIGISTSGMPLRTRSKFVKEQVCNVLGYPIPKSFKKTNPRFIGQNFDTYIQKSNNLQVWNEELEASRRYVMISVDENDLIKIVKVVNGDVLAELDTTGTLTQKYQAKLTPSESQSELISNEDTSNLIGLTSNEEIDLSTLSPISQPHPTELMNIEGIYNKLIKLVGVSFPDLGADQERNRGGELHKLVCSELGYTDSTDDGQFPDIKHQLIEIKLQTSPTIDLGLVEPISNEPLDFSIVDDVQLRHCDVRYVLFYGEIVDGVVNITNFYLTTGEDFFTRFPRFEGKVLNKKIQIPLPKSFFN